MEMGITVSKSRNFRTFVAFLAKIIPRAPEERQQNTFGKLYNLLNSLVPCPLWKMHTIIYELVQLDFVFFYFLQPHINLEILVSPKGLQMFSSKRYMSYFCCCLIHKGSPQLLAPHVWFGRIFIFVLHQMPFLMEPKGICVSFLDQTGELSVLGKCVNHFNMGSLFF